MNELKGLGTALVTPFKSDGAIDYLGLERLVEHNILGGVNYLVIQGTTGETAVLNKSERVDVFNFIVELNNERVPLVLGIGGNNTHQVLSEYDWFNLDNVNAILSSSPAYNKPTQAGIIAHYKYLADNGEKPIILYNVPGRTASNLTSETTLELAKHTAIIGIKEASGNLDQLGRIIKNKPSDFLVISGEDGLSIPMMAMGIDGVTSVISNAFPKEFSKMLQLCLDNDYASARSIHYKLIDIIDLIFKENNPAGIKAMLEIKGICEKHTRLPLLPATKNLISSLSKFKKCE